jgi:hypothetical protein
MQASEVPRAVAAAKSTASSLGLTADEVIVLHDSNKLTLRLLPCDVLARVAPAGRQVAQFELELAQQLLESGCPVAALEPRVQPRVYERDGFVVTLWTYYEPVTPREVSPADYAIALAQLHAGMCKLDVATPHFGDRVDQAQQLVASRDDTPALADADRELLGDTLRGPGTRDRRTRRCRAAAARRATPGQRAHHEERAAVHRPRDMSPWDCGIRPRPCARRSQRALSGYQSWPAARVPDPRAGDDHNVALGPRRPTPKRAPAGHRVAQPDPSSARTQWAGYPRLIPGLRDLVGCCSWTLSHPSSGYPVNLPCGTASCAGSRSACRTTVYPRPHPSDRPNRSSSPSRISSSP